jgi:hypothetical protein
LEVKVAGTEQTEIERLRYWQGQMLRSRDFRDSARMENQMRYWHNRALHNAYGVSFGLEVDEVRKTTSDPLIAVSVSCGVAYDCFGRELILSTTRQVTIPPAPKDKPAPRIPEQKNMLVLVMRYRQTTAGCCSSTEPAGVCWPAENEPAIESEFVWARVDYSRSTEGVPLARVIYDNAGAVTLDDQFIAPRAKPLARPFLASGETIPGNTLWEVWNAGVPAGPSRTRPSEKAVGMQTRIDTSTAGFTETPLYFAWLEGAWNESDTIFQPLLMPSIANASPDGFTFRLLMPEIVMAGVELRIFNDRFAVFFPLLVQRKKLYVCWLGCQPLTKLTCSAS